MADPEKAMEIENDHEDVEDEEVDAKADVSELLKNPALMQALQGKLNSMVGMNSGYIAVLFVWFYLVSSNFAIAKCLTNPFSHVAIYEILSWWMALCLILTPLTLKTFSLNAFNLLFWVTFTFSAIKSPSKAIFSRMCFSLFQSLPAPVKRRLKALKKIQLESTKIEAKFYEEVHKLECKYHELYKPLYEQRVKITKGTSSNFISHKRDK